MDELIAHGLTASFHGRTLVQRLVQRLIHSELTPSDCLHHPSPSMGGSNGRGHDSLINRFTSRDSKFFGSDHFMELDIAATQALTN